MKIDGYMATAKIKKVNVTGDVLESPRAAALYLFTKFPKLRTCDVIAAKNGPVPGLIYRVFGAGKSYLGVKRADAQTLPDVMPAHAQALPGFAVEAMA